MRQHLWMPLFALVSATALLTGPTWAGPHFLPRLRLPNINLSKAAKVVAYPVTKSLGNGGKTALKTVENAVGTAETARAIVTAVNPTAGKALSSPLWGVGRH